MVPVRSFRTNYTPCPSKPRHPLLHIFTPVNWISKCNLQSCGIVRTTCHQINSGISVDPHIANSGIILSTKEQMVEGGREVGKERWLIVSLTHPHEPEHSENSEKSSAYSAFVAVKWSPSPFKTSMNIICFFFFFLSSSYSIWLINKAELFEVKFYLKGVFFFSKFGIDFNNFLFDNFVFHKNLMKISIEIYENKEESLKNTTHNGICMENALFQVSKKHLFIGILNAFLFPQWWYDIKSYITGMYVCMCVCLPIHNIHNLLCFLHSDWNCQFL